MAPHASPHSASEPETLFRAFCERSLPKPEWTHEAHLVVCAMALRGRDPADAAVFLRSAIRAYNEATGVANTRTGGYHDTITQYYVGAVAALGEESVGELSVGEAPVGEVLRSPTCDRSAPLRHWSRALLFGPEARAGWIEPDLGPLPWAWTPPS